MFEHGRDFRGLLLRGCAATIGVVLFRLAMPWPLRGFIELVVPGQDHRGRVVVDLLPAWGEPLIWLALIYILIALGSGICELVQRVAMKKYAAYTMHRMRASGVEGVLSGSEQLDEDEAADLITRLIGDSARAKAEWSGILVHVSPTFLNSLLQNREELHYS